MDIATLTDRLARKFRGASIDDIEGITDFSIFGEAAGNLLSALDPYETVRLMRFNVFQGIYDYAPAADLKGKKVIDPRPQDGRVGEEFSQTFTKEFDRDKQIGKVSVESLDGAKVVRLATSGAASMKVDQTEVTTEWAAGGGATGLEIDEVITLDGADTLRVDLGATGGYLEAGVAGTMTQVDLTDFLSIGSFFRKVYIPTAAQAASITSVTLLIGSASTEYYTITGQVHFGSWKAGVNLVRFDWADGVKTLSPTITAYDYERLTFVTTGAIADVRVGPMTVKLGTPFETPYYSNCLFTDSTGATWQDTPTATSDLIVLEQESLNIFFYECCQLIAEDLSLDEEAVKFKFKLNGDPQKSNDDGGLYGQYKRDKPTETLSPHAHYMTFRRRPSGSRCRIWRE
jgi:hypothetical protein